MSYHSVWTPIHKADLRNLRHYKYSAVDKSLLSKYVLSYYWDWLVGFFPLWVAPNLITFVGLLFIVSSYLIVAAVSPNLEVSVLPRWTYFWYVVLQIVGFAACIWINATLDSIDGKQARRTKSASPLGELFDHGCDALNLALMPPVAMQIFGLEAGWITIIFSLIAYTVFYMATWETYHTKILYLGHISGPIEGTLLLAICSLLTGIYGVQIWDNRVKSVIPMLSQLEWLPNAQLKTISWGFVIICGAGSIYASLKHVLGRHSPWSLLRVVPFLLFCVQSCWWCHVNPMFLRGSDHLLFLTLMGFSFADAVSCVITAHVTDGKYPLATVAYVPIVARTLWTILSMMKPHWAPTTMLDRHFAALSLAFTTALFMLRLARTVQILCEHLGIYCFRIKPTAKRGGDKGKRQ